MRSPNRTKSSTNPESRSGSDFFRVLTPRAIERVRRGHPWIWKSDLTTLKNFPEIPSVLALGEHWYFWDPEQSLCLRRFGSTQRFWLREEKLPFDSIDTENEFREHFGNELISYFHTLLQVKRSRVGFDSCFRWIFGDADGIPGLVLDVFDDTIVVQAQHRILSQFQDSFHQVISEALLKGGMKCENVLWDRELSSAEMLKQISWNGFRWKMSPGFGQKTGGYLDQRENHCSAARWAKRLEKKTAWDIFSFQGGFGIHLASVGCQVLCVDSSQEALDLARENAALNAIPTQRIDFLRSDGFDFLKSQALKKSQVDVIVLDPPPFSPTKKDRTRALSAHHELTFRSLQCLPIGGILIHCSCSNAVSNEDFGRMIQEVAHRSRRRIHVLDVAGPSSDHAPSIDLPESGYLQAWFLQVF